MIKIKRSILVIGVLLSFGFCASAQESKVKTKTSLNPLSGRWVEYWSYNKHSDVKYNDTFRISFNNGEVALYSVGPHIYQFDNIKLVNNRLSFVLINGSYKLPYRLQLNMQKNIFYGSATGIDKLAVKVKWEKIAEKSI